MPSKKAILTRKDEHIRINLEKKVAFQHTTTQFEQYQFLHEALPEINLEAVDTSTTFLGHRLAMPLLIAPMTGGSPLGKRLNRALAEAAQAAGIGMGLGSMRAVLEAPETLASFQVRRYAPDIFLLANLGAVQLNYGYGPEDCRRLVEMVEADALYLHLNPLQEALQPEGDTRFAGLAARIAEVCAALPVPVIVKEVGCGLSRRAATRLLEAGVAALDVAGAGGTSWSRVELHRQRDRDQHTMGRIFSEWGIPTAQSLRLAQEAAPTLPLIASGGLRDGLDIAKALALGADLTTMAGALLPIAATAPETLSKHLELIRRQLQVTMFTVGARDIAALKQTPLLPLSAYLEAP